MHSGPIPMLDMEISAKPNISKALEMLSLRHQGKQL